MMTTLGFLNPDSIQSIVCSDINSDVLEIAAKNLSLLSIDGLNERIAHLGNLYAQFGMEPHLQAIESAARLMGIIGKGSGINTAAFAADILGQSPLSDKGFRADIVFTDIPYGNLVSWHEDEGSICTLLENLIPVIGPGSVVAVCSNKRQKVLCERYVRLEKHQIGKRKFEILALR
jgi:hypothetical protein